MIYFSELKGKEVFTEDEIKVGKLEDAIFIAGETPLITKFIVRNTQDLKMIIPIDFLLKINKRLLIKKEYVTAILDENELFVVKNLLDKQIIDLKGNKIVRVNDIAIQDKAEFGKLYISGVDIGLRGIIRWIGFDEFFDKVSKLFKLTNPTEFLSWGDIQPLELIRGHVKLKRKEEKLQKIRPEDLADYLEKTNIFNTSKFLKILDDNKVAEVIEHLNINYQTSLFKYFHSEKSAKIISLIDPDDAVDILLALSPKKREDILRNFSPKKRSEILHLIQLSGNKIGDLATSQFLAVKSEDTVREVIDKIKKETSSYSYLYYIFVINKTNQLVGVFNLHELLMQDLDTPIYKFMIQEVIVVHLTTPEDIVIKRLLRYKLDALPIIDNNKVIQGIITFDDIAEKILMKK
ncbi:MAG: hypothetical protein US11_C0004G0076 [Candidatus Roizmanbacteria bacterium GW2011_GWA2_36_23]|uniref:CBS domain-containing protein n=1 Tax=Candidatus Roizmanbacteria bacterium GW2011_GWA2_36_23 TaxID=1618480 RepID=A0A0G0HD19_9BACT|nr:MAG: hypothetical protein US11_C0004G0076 [Candidatus Roizmanbacteria bacterium GW2011_GWA2_36_23]